MAGCTGCAQRAQLLKAAAANLRNGQVIKATQQVATVARSAATSVKRTISPLAYKGRPR